MRRKKTKPIWLYLDGKKHCDVIEWALAANVDKDEAKKMLSEMYAAEFEVSFKVQ